MDLPDTKTTAVMAVIVLLLGAALFTLAAVLTCESPRWEVSPLGFVRLRCADAASWTGLLFSGARWRLSFNLFLCVPWPLIILIAAVIRWVKGGD